MSCWASRGRGREKGRASLSSAGSSAGTLPQRGWPGSRLPSRGSTLRGVSVGGQSRRNWVSSASSESSFRKRLIWGGKGVRKEGTPAAAPLSIGTPKPPQPASCTPKAGAGGNLGEKKEEGDNSGSPRTGMGGAWGQQGPCTPRRGRLQLVAWGGRTAPGAPGGRDGDCPPWPCGGAGHPHAPWGLLGWAEPPHAPWPAGSMGKEGRGGGEKRDERQQPWSWGANRGLLVGSPWKLPWESQPTGGLPDWGQG